MGIRNFTIVADSEFDSETFVVTLQDTSEVEVETGTTLTAVGSAALATSTPNSVYILNNNDGTYSGRAHVDDDFDGYFHYVSANIDEKLRTTPDADSSEIRPRYLTRDVPIIPEGAASTVEWTILNDAKEAVSVAGRTLRLVAVTVDEDFADDNELFDATLTPAFSYDTSGGLTIGGADDNVVTLVHDATKTATPGTYRYFLWDVTNNIPLARGRMPIIPAAIAAVA